MELKDIKIICQDILNQINNSGKGLIYRNYETFLSLFGMKQRRHLETLEKADYQLKKHGITFWAGKDKRASVIDFQRGETITLRIAESANSQTGFMNEGARKAPYHSAGTISIANADSGITLYKHQQEAIDNLQAKIINSGKNDYAGLLVLPTGGGKTLTAAYWLAKYFLDKGKKVLWIAHRHELLDQAKQTFQQRLAYKDIFSTKSSFNYRIISGIHDKPVNIKATDDIIISSKDSLNAGFNYLIKNWIKGDEELFLVIDEAHHTVAKTYRKIISNLGAKVETLKMIGLTATPYRTAEVENGLLARIFPDDILYKVDLRTLISRGILSEPVFEEVNTDFNMREYLSDQEIQNLKYFDIESIGKATAKTIAENYKRNWIIVNQYKSNKNKYKQTIVFALNQDNAIALSKLFEQEGIRSAYVLSSIKDSYTGVTVSAKGNKEKIDQFRQGQLDVIINVNILTEGTDLPNVQSIFLARPTISSILMTQMIGRGLRGERAGGTKNAHIVSFIDDWKDLVNWVNPERLLIEENIDFNNRDADTRKQIIRLISISKIEEFAILTNKIIDGVAKEELEKLDFIERIPVGIFHFSLLIQIGIGNEQERNCEVLVYDNIFQSYSDFIEALPEFFRRENIAGKDNLSGMELTELSSKIEALFFFGCEKYPGYRVDDIKDILQYYAQSDIIPKYIALNNRDKYDISRVGKEILAKNLGRRDEENFKNNLWESNESEWKAFFGYDKKYFLNEIDLAIRRLSNPDLFKKANIIPENVQELRKLEEMSMQEIREINPEYWKRLSDSVYKKYRDKDGFYSSATGEYKSRNKLDFQIDHIKSRHNGGLTTLDNLQLLTRKENAIKSSGNGLRPVDK